MIPFLPLQSGEVLKKVKEHTKQINDIQTSVDLTMFITASKDNTAKVNRAAPLARVIVLPLKAAHLSRLLVVV